MFPPVEFFVAALVLAVTPGPGIAYVVARTAARGRADGLASCAGTGLGGLLHVVAAAFGLSMLLAQSATAFSVVKYVGAAYLVYLGIKLLVSKPSPAGSAAVKTGARRAFLEGILVEALNVKTALFFLAFLPQFSSDASSIVPRLVAMGSFCVALNTLVDVGAVLGATRLLSSNLSGGQRARLLNRMSGVTLVGLGLYVAASKRGV